MKTVTALFMNEREFFQQQLFTCEETIEVTDLSDSLRVSACTESQLPQAFILKHGLMYLLIEEEES
jgi:hypothetical protein